MNSNELLCEAGLEHDFNCLIVKRIFGVEFVVVRRDPSKMRLSLEEMIFHTSNGGRLCV